MTVPAPRSYFDATACGAVLPVAFGLDITGMVPFIRTLSYIRR